LSEPRTDCRPRDRAGGRLVGRSASGSVGRNSAAPADDEDRADNVSKWMFLRLHDVDTSLCFTAAAAAAASLRGVAAAAACMPLVPQSPDA